MTTLVLVRHGRPDWDFRTPIAGHALGAWLQGERDARLDRLSRPSAELEALVRNAQCLVTSPLRRAVESALLLSPSSPPTVDEDVREAALPAPFRSGLSLPPMVWSGFARSAWFCGWSPGVESFRNTRVRAARAATRLHALVERRGDLVVIGHGLMNTLIATRLRALGWNGARFPSRIHWGFTIYQR